MGSSEQQNTNLKGPSSFLLLLVRHLLLVAMHLFLVAYCFYKLFFVFFVSVRFMKSMVWTCPICAQLWLRRREE